MTKGSILSKTLIGILILGFTGFTLFCDAGVKLKTFRDLAKPRGLYIDDQRLVISQNHHI